MKNVCAPGGKAWTKPDLLAAIPELQRARCGTSVQSRDGRTRETLTFTDQSFWRFGFYVRSRAVGSGFNVRLRDPPPVSTHPQRNRVGRAVPCTIPQRFSCPVATISMVRAVARRRGDEAHRPVRGSHPRLAHGGRHDGGRRRRHPGYTWFSTSNDSLWLTLAAPGISLVLLVAARRRAAARRRELLAGRLCLRCGYDLHLSRPVPRVRHPHARRPGQHPCRCRR